MPKVTVTITQEELNQIIANQFNLTSDIEVIVEPCEDGPDQDGWITWNGGECPVDSKTLVEMEIRSGEKSTGTAGDWWWGCDNQCYDIVAYRVVKE